MSHLMNRYDIQQPYNAVISSTLVCRQMRRDRGEGLLSATTVKLVLSSSIPIAANCGFWGGGDSLGLYVSTQSQ